MHRLKASSRGMTNVLTVQENMSYNTFLPYPYTLKQVTQHFQIAYTQLCFPTIQSKVTRQDNAQRLLPLDVTGFIECNSELENVIVLTSLMTKQKKNKDLVRSEDGPQQGSVQRICATAFFHSVSPNMFSHISTSFSHLHSGIHFIQPLLLP